MKKAAYSLLLFIFLFLSNGLQAQKKITISQTVTGIKPTTGATGLKSINWIADSDWFTWIDGDENLLKENVSSGQKDTVLTNMRLNKMMAADSGNLHILEYNWINTTSLFINTGNNLFVINTIENKIEKQWKLPSTAKNAIISPDYTHVAFTERNNLFVMDGNGEIQTIAQNDDANIVCGQIVSRNEFGITGGIFWSPNGQKLAFYRKDETRVTNYPLVDIDQRIATLKNIKYPMAGMKSEWVSIGVYDFKNANTVWIENDTIEKYLTSVTWSPDGNALYAGLLNREQNFLKLNGYNAQSGVLIKTLFEEKNTKYVEPEFPLYFVSANQFIWLSERDGYMHLYLYQTDGQLLKQLTSGNWVVTEFLGYNELNKTAYYLSTEPSPIEQGIYGVNISNKKRVKVSTEPGTHSCTLQPKGKWLIDRYSNVNEPITFELVTLKGKIVRQLYKSEDVYKDYDISKPQIFTLQEDKDSLPLICRIIKPSNMVPGKKYPVIVYVYGGPHVQLIANMWLGGASLWDYYMAQQGYIIFTLDNRGSANRGFDFESSVHRNLGKLEMVDQMRGITYLSKLDFVDTSRIGVYGWSFGGFMSTTLKLNHPEIFKVAVAGGPVINWKWYEVMYGERYMDTPDENPIGYSSSNLLNKVGNLKGKLLLIHGGVDPVVVWQNSLAFLEEAVKNNILVDYFVYPVHEHNVRGLDRIHLNKMISQYFIDNL